MVRTAPKRVPINKKETIIDTEPTVVVIDSELTVETKAIELPIGFDEELRYHLIAHEKGTGKEVLNIYHKDRSQLELIRDRCNISKTYNPITIWDLKHGTTF